MEITSFIVLIALATTISLLIVCGQQVNGASFTKQRKAINHLEQNLELISPLGYKNDKRDFKWIETHYEDTNDKKSLEDKRRVYNGDRSNGWIEEYQVYKVKLPKARANTHDTETSPSTTTTTTTQAPLPIKEHNSDLTESGNGDKLYPQEVVKDPGWKPYKHDPNWRAPPDADKMRKLLDEFRARRKFSANNQLGNNEVPKHNSDQQF